MLYSVESCIIIPWLSSQGLVLPKLMRKAAIANAALNAMIALVNLHVRTTARSASVVWQRWTTTVLGSTIALDSTTTITSFYSLYFWHALRYYFQLAWYLGASRHSYT